MSMNGRVALVTGASQGIGEGIARALHAAGAKVALLARNAVRLQGVTDTLGEGAFAAVGDETDAGSLTHV